MERNMSVLVECIGRLADPSPEDMPGHVRVSRVSLSLVAARELVAEFLDQLTVAKNPATFEQISLCGLKEQFLDDPLAVTQRIVDAGFFVRDIRIEIQK
jgi:hypothetical protein